MNEFNLTTPPPKSRLLPRLIVSTSGILITLILLFVWLNRSPSTEYPISVTILPGTSASAVVNQLAEYEVVRSEFVLYVWLVAFHDPSAIKAGTYTFSEPRSAREVATYIASEIPADELVRLTFPEGVTIAQMADISETLLPEFDAEMFTASSTLYEGKFWPDTYFVPVEFTTEELVMLLQDSYEEHMTEIREAVGASPFTEDEVIILASVIEREANSVESMRMVSGILQNRLAIDMPLQADASIEYILDKPLQELTPEDLEIDSPYNTYQNIGLPPTPIGNPGLAAIEAVLYPTPSEYFYYLTDQSGQFYYASTYDEHLTNIELYLK